MYAEGLIGIAQIDSVSGDFEYNSKNIIKYIKKAKNEGASIVIFPLNVLSGNLIEDVINSHPALKAEIKKWLNCIAEFADDITVILGYMNNSVAIIENGKVYEIISDFPYIYKNICITTGDILESDLIINLTKSCGKETALIHSSLKYSAQKFSTPVVCVNSVGATDNISYIGSSAVFDSAGELITRLKAFEEHYLTVNLSRKCEVHPLPLNAEPSVSFSLDYEQDMERVYKTIIQGIKGYFTKCGIRRAVLGLSGGLDSTVCAVLLTEALGKENVLGISMPSVITSNESMSDAKQLAQNLGIHFTEAPIKPMVNSVSECFNELFSNIKWDDRYKKSYTNDNIQARLRAMYLYGVSNEFASCIPIATSDKSEAYMGYATINGDMSGGFAPIADVTKTKLFALARWINKNIKDVIPQSVIDKRPGAELAIDEKTGKPLKAEDALMPYEFLDEIIWRVENIGQGYNDFLNIEFLYEKSHDVSVSQKLEWLDKFYSRMSKALYKWSIMPPAVILDDVTINKMRYYQPITSSRINYKGYTDEEIKKICKDL